MRRFLTTGLFVAALIESTVLAAPLAIFSSVDDFDPDMDNTTPGYATAPWWAAQHGPEVASHGLPTGPYTAMGWDSSSGNNRYSITPGPTGNQGQLSKTVGHVGHTTNANIDVMHTFRAPTAGRYLIIGNVGTTNISSDGVRMQLYRGNGSGTDSALGNHIVVQGIGTAGQPSYGLGKVAVQHLTAPANTSNGQNQIYFRVMDNGHFGSDGMLHNHFVYQIADTAPQPGTVYSSQANFQTGANRFGQNGDPNANGDPTWFYQFGSPGNSNTYTMLSYRNTDIWRARDINIGGTGTTQQGPLYNSLQHGEVVNVPGPNNATSWIRSWVSTFDGTVDISGFIADRNVAGDGVTFGIYLNDTLLGPTQLVDGATVNFSETDLAVTVGDFIHFAASPGATDTGDGFDFLAEILVTDSNALVPEPASIALWGGLLVGLGLFWRRQQRA